jgi:hypothetical protein
MATRSTIWIKTDEGYRGIYCHFDGVLERVGKTLVTHYTDINKINKLIDLGSISVLGSEIGNKIDFYNNNTNNQTIAYHRDRGDDLYIYESNDMKGLDRFKEEYNYLFENGKWKYFCDYAHNINPVTI